MTDNPDHSAKLMIGTNKGIYRAPIEKIDEATQVLDAKHVLRLCQFGDEIFAATRSGLYRSTDRGETWDNLEVPRTEVYSVFKSPDGKRLYAGTHPAHLYISDDHDKSWRELEGFQALPSRDSWRLPRHRNEAHVRSIGGTAERLIAGVEVGGVHVSEDAGETWTERRDGLHDDIHHVLIIEADEYIASTGGGLYRTRDTGRSWTRIDKELGHTYFREAFTRDGRLYAAAARSAPPAWSGEKGTDAALFESTDGGDTFQSVSYPGQPKDFILAWTTSDRGDSNVIAGTRNGRVLQRTNDGWIQTGSIPLAIRSLAVV